MGWLTGGDQACGDGEWADEGRTCGEGAEDEWAGEDEDEEEPTGDMVATPGGAGAGRGGERGPWMT